MTCILRMYKDDGAESYSCFEVRKLFPYWKKEFREANNSDKVEKDLGVDKKYQEYIKNIQSFLDKCKHEKEYLFEERRNKQLWAVKSD